MTSAATTHVRELLAQLGRLKALHRAGESPSWGQVEALFDQAAVVEAALGLGATDPSRPSTWPTSSRLPNDADGLVELVVVTDALKAFAPARRDGRRWEAPVSTWVGRPTGTAHCAFGHTWPVTLTWSPVVLDGTLVPNTWTFAASPRWCEACFLASRLVTAFDGVVCDEGDRDPAGPAAAQANPVTVEEGASHVTDPR